MSIELTFSLISSILREYHQIFNSLRMIVKLATVKGSRHAAMLLKFNKSNSTLACFSLSNIYFQHIKNRSSYTCMHTSPYRNINLNKQRYHISINPPISSANKEVGRVGEVFEGQSCCSTWKQVTRVTGYYTWRTRQPMRNSSPNKQYSTNIFNYRSPSHQ